MAIQNYKTLIGISHQYVVPLNSFRNVEMFYLILFLDAKLWYFDTIYDI